MLFASVLFATDDAPLKPVADPQPILKDLQQKMSSLGSVYFELTQERQAGIVVSIGVGCTVIAIPVTGCFRAQKPHRPSILANKVYVSLAIKHRKRADHIVDNLDDVFAREQDYKRNRPGLVETQNVSQRGLSLVSVGASRAEAVDCGQECGLSSEIFFA